MGHASTCDSQWGFKTCHLFLFFWFLLSSSSDSHCIGNVILLKASLHDNLINNMHFNRKLICTINILSNERCKCLLLLSVIAIFIREAWVLAKKYQFTKRERHPGAR